MPSNAAVQSGLYVTDFGGDASISWADGKSGTITMHCPIPTGVAPSPTHVELYFKNNITCTGCSADHVKVQYMKMSKSSGAITSVATLDSTSGVNDGSYQGISANISDTYNTSLYVYYLRVDLIRTSTSNVANDQRFYMSVVY